MTSTVFIGYDPRQTLAYRVCCASLRHHARGPVNIHPISMGTLGARYQRPTEVREPGHQLWDVISSAPMSTEFALARFWVPRLHRNGWAVFCDGDVLWRAPVEDLLALADDRFAVMVVKHNHHVKHEGVTKMDGRLQTGYERKNWSSVVLWNCAHPAHDDVRDSLNKLRGIKLHQFCWLKDEQIGGLPMAWNHLVGIDSPDDPVLGAHFTLGTPNLPGYADVYGPLGEEWGDYARR